MARGDRLEVERGLPGSFVRYFHHGIDMGDGTVVHARPFDFGNPFGGGSIVRTSYEEFAGGRTVRRVPFTEVSFSADDIASRAASQVGRAGYCPVFDNCEHFVNWCATGAPTSHQIHILANRAQGVAARTATALTARVAAGTAGRVAVRTAAGMTVRVGLLTMVPAAMVCEAAALATEWRAHQAGRDKEACRRAGDRAGLAASALTFAVAGAAAGPPGVLAGAFAGMTIWAWGTLVSSLVTGVADRACRTDPGFYDDSAMASALGSDELRHR
jgi:hypothetical protein